MLTLRFADVGVEHLVMASLVSSQVAQGFTALSLAIGFGVQVAQGDEGFVVAMFEHALILIHSAVGRASVVDGGRTVVLLAALGSQALSPVAIVWD